MKRAFLICLWICGSLMVLWGCDGVEPSQVGSPRVLFMGNSYTHYNRLPEMFARLARSGGEKVDVGMSAHGGWTLENHRKADLTRKKLAEKKWDFVVLQEQSVIPSLPTKREKKMYPAARQLNAMIREKGAETILFLTWGRRGGEWNYGHRTYEDMQRKLHEGYDEIARELGVKLAPVGLAWRRVLSEKPELEAVLWNKDGSHPGKAGTYLAACVFYAVIYKKSPEGLSFQAGLEPETAGFLQKAAAETVLK